MREYDWDGFWDFAARSKLFLRLLYGVHFKQYRKLLKGIPLSAPRILELGAGTGVIPQKLLSRFGGSAVLVDNNSKAFSLFQEFRVEGLAVNYIREDVFTLDMCDEFDLVCSDGLLEHFDDADREKLIAIHRRAVKPNGFVVLFVPNDTSTMRFLNRRAPDFGREGVFSLSNLEALCRANGLTVIARVSYFFEVGVLCVRM